MVVFVYVVVLVVVYGVIFVFEPVVMVVLLVEVLVFLLIGMCGCSDVSWLYKIGPSNLVVYCMLLHILLLILSVCLFRLL